VGCFCQLFYFWYLVQIINFSLIELPTILFAVWSETIGCIYFICPGCAEHVLANEVVLKTLQIDNLNQIPKIKQLTKAWKWTVIWAHAIRDLEVQFLNPIIKICLICIIGINRLKEKFHRNPRKYVKLFHAM
jgi:hypothetical protein